MSQWIFRAISSKLLGSINSGGFAGPIYDEIEQTYNKLKRDNPGLSEEEIGKLLQRQMPDKSKDTNRSM